LIRSADIRYTGQSYELTVPWHGADPAEPFHAEHQRVYGYSNPERAIEIVTIRVRARREVEKPALLSPRQGSRGSRKAKVTPDIRRIHSSGAWRDTAVYPRSSLPAAALPGPALILDYGSTTLIPPGWSFSLDKSGSLKITRRRKR
jgi:N-methylhydantoinase A